VPLVLFLILGLTALIPPDDLSSKTTVVTAVIFFIAASVLSLGPTLPPRVYGPSFAETTLYYLLFIAATFLGEAILENRFFGGKKGKAKHPTSYFVMQVAMVTLAVGLIIFYTSYFGSLAATFWWSALDPISTLILPVVAVASGATMNIALHTRTKNS
jgi:hypothetical protein